MFIIQYITSQNRRYTMEIHKYKNSSVNDACFFVCLLFVVVVVVVVVVCLFLFVCCFFCFAFFLFFFFCFFYNVTLAYGHVYIDHRYVQLRILLDRVGFYTR